MLDADAEGIAAVRTWIFPKPQGGKVVATYPCVFASASPAERAAPGGK
jgi:hypothetical protein